MTPQKKPHVSDQNCGNCAFSRPRYPEGNGIECRWSDPPWHDKGVRPSEWCRRWGVAPAPKQKPEAKP